MVMPKCPVETGASSVEQLSFARGEAALAHCIVVAIADRAHRRAHSHFLASEAEGHRGVLRSPVALMDHAIGFALRNGHVHRIKHQLRSLPGADRPADGEPLMRHWFKHNGERG